MAITVEDLAAAVLVEEEDSAAEAVASAGAEAVSVEVAREGAGNHVLTMRIRHFLNNVEHDRVHRRINRPSREPPVTLSFSSVIAG